jgi:Fur family transcriptional regulator, ferric uptake regulator
MLRKTKQRATLGEVLSDFVRPLTVHEIHERALQKTPGLGIATVYRLIKAMMEGGELKPVEIAGQPLRYERTNLDHHHHFVCNSCQKVFPLEGCLPLGRLLPAGFKMTHHEITLRGVCLACG